MKIFNLLIIVFQQSIKMNKFGSNKLSQYQQKVMNQIVRIPSIVQSTATPSLNMRSSQISNIMECPLCKQSIRQSHLCPSCCRMFCENCIKSWLKGKKNECPCCQKPLNIINLINCSGLGRQIEQVISKSVQKIKNPQVTPLNMISPTGSRILAKDQTILYESPSPKKEKQLQCENHQLKIEYFCQDCLLGLCSDCAVLSQHHQGHRICRVSQKRISFQEKIRLNKSNLRDLRQIVTKVRDDKISAMNQTKVNQAQKQSQASMNITKLGQYHISKLDEHFFMKEGQLKMILQKFEKNLQQVSYFSDFLSTKSKVKLVQNSHYISNCMNQSLKDDGVSILKEPPFVLQSAISPQFETKTYILYNYNYLREKGDILISQPLFYKGTEWKLKIFPRGVNLEQKGVMNQFLGIHIQMSKGFKQDNRYRFRLQLVNQKNRQQCMSYQNEVQFREGSEEHIDRFIQVSSLYNLNFVNSESGFIQVILYIKSASFFHGVRQQMEMICEKEREIEEKGKVIQTLEVERKKLGTGMSEKEDGRNSERETQNIVDNNN